ncbi:chaperonin 10-like protein [Phialemonium atrogriseum]|uniref:Chaperonin 10-like protein n=1 Tax=Phialemonium atrogriseum TaxID=1093897 RepID=A0AAJ0FI36_9PEZI|nr:chaperonin 10-like protein [Phialemonium atrogriseum]KAK1763978.1 chaperonin 10-like protein [Phialemonium atrogriseum]
MGSIIAETMLAAQYNVEKNKIEVNRVPIPQAIDVELLIKTTCATLCHSDLMLFWGHTAEKPPTDTITIGHENTGVVVAMGKDVKGFKIGDKVGCLGCSYACYECEGCQVHNLFCEKGTQRLHGFQTAGHFAEYSTADYRNAMVLPDGMDMVGGAPLFCAGVTAYHSIKGCDLQEGQWVAIIGCGGLGHLAIQYAKAMGLRVIGLDISEAQLESARQLGADAIFNPARDPDYQRKIKEMTNGGCHATAVYSASNKAYQDAPATLRINGLLMIVGIPKEELSISALDILLGKYRIAGRSSGVPQNMPEAIHFSHKHNIKSHVNVFRDINDIQRMAELMEAGKTAGRFGIVFD